MKKIGKVLTVVGWIMILGAANNIITQFIHPHPGVYNPEPFSVHWIGAMLGKMTFIALAITAIHYGRIFQSRR